MRIPCFTHSKRMAGLLGMIVWTAISGCAAIQKKPGSTEPIALEQERIWIFDAARTQSSFNRAGRCSALPFGMVTGTWTPDSQVVRRLDPIVRRAVDTAISDGTPIRGNDYHIQYFGIVIEGHRLVYVNGVHRILTTNMLREPERELAESPVVICDAGRGAFQTEYDVQTQQLGILRFESSYGGPSPQS